VRYVETAAQSVESRLDSIELRLDQLEQAQSTLPELLDLLQPEQLSPVHQTMVRRWVNDLAHLTGWHITMIFQDLVVDFADLSLRPGAATARDGTVVESEGGVHKHLKGLQAEGLVRSSWETPQNGRAGWSTRSRRLVKPTCNG
jgi:hypothetical protein